MHITSRENPAVKEIVRLAGSAKARREAGLFVCEGSVLLKEALLSGLAPQSLFCLASDLGELPERLPCPAHTVSESVLEKLCGVKTPRGPVFTLKVFEREPPQSGPVVALDDVRDPGNMGTVIRCADAFGVSVALLGECADIFAPKVVRAAMGSLFRANVWRSGYSELGEYCFARGIDVYCAALGEQSLPITGANLKNACVIIGNEARGVGAPAFEIARGSIVIPMKGAQSLNAAVAAAICMWEAVR